MMIEIRCDVLVVGAGILGLSSAYHLKLENPDERVVIIDRQGGPGEGNTARSEGAFRNTFASKTNRELADTTIDWFGHLEEEGYDLKLAFTGYLWLFSQEQYGRLRGAVESMERGGVEVRLYHREELEEMIPEMVTGFEGDEEAELLGLEPIEVGIFGPKCGSIDVDALVRYYQGEFLKLGGEAHYGVEARKLILGAERELGIPGEPHIWQEARIKGVETDRGRIEAETTVVAAGVWSGRLLEPIGFDPYMRPKKRQLFLFRDRRLEGLMDVEGFNEYGVHPLTILPKAGIYFKVEPHERSIWLGYADDIGRPFTLEEDPKPEPEYYERDIYPVLVKYLPCFRDVHPSNMWAGHYAINSFDAQPVVASIPGLIYVGAASGSGVMKCDALGRIVAALYAGRVEAELYGGRRFRVSDLGVRDRRVERESFII